MKSFRAVVSGRVQGVGFRYFVERHASRLGIIGFVRNMHDGSVEVCAQGEDEKIDEFFALVQKGPSFSYVSDIDIEWGVYKPEKDLKFFIITF